jgi:protein SCO1/2
MSTATAFLSRREMLFGRACAENQPAQPDLSYRASAVVARMAGIAAPARVSSRMPDCQVVSHRDERYRFISDLVADRRVIIGFIYTHCEGICPTTTKHMAEAYKLLKERSTEPFVMLSITIDPERDTPDALLRYAVRNGVANIDDWHFLTASKADTTALLRALRQSNAEGGDELAQNNHTGVLIFGNDSRDRWGGIGAGSEPIHIANTFERTARTRSLRHFAGFATTAEEQ